MGDGVNELAFVAAWCLGVAEVTLEDRSRVDCLQDSVAWEVDKGANWKEAVGQALHYGRMTQRRPGILLTEPHDIHIHLLRQLVKHYGLDVKITAAHRQPDGTYDYEEVVP